MRWKLAITAAPGADFSSLAARLLCYSIALVGVAYFLVSYVTSDLADDASPRSTQQRAHVCERPCIMVMYGRIVMHAAHPP